MREVKLTLLGKPGCHLCDDARVALDEVLSSAAIADAGLTITLTEVNILDDQALLEKHVEEIPVLFINDRMHSYWHIDKERLIRALTES